MISQIFAEDLKINLYNATFIGEAANWICGKCCGFVTTDRTTTPPPHNGVVDTQNFIVSCAF